MKVNIEGKEVEAYHLIMKKENALEIINGTKKIEVRDFNQKYGQMFIDPKKEAEYFEKMKQSNFEYIDQNGVAECDKIYKGIKYIYFTNYNKSWHLVVKISHINMLWFNDDDMNFLENELNFKDYKEGYEEFKKNYKEGDEIPAIFAITIESIVSHENLN